MLLNFFCMNLKHALSFCLPMLTAITSYICAGAVVSHGSSLLDPGMGISFMNILWLGGGQEAIIGITNETITYLLE